MAGSSEGKYYGIWRKKNSEGRFSVKDVSEEVRYLEYQKKASAREACLVQ